MNSMSQKAENPLHQTAYDSVGRSIKASVQGTNGGMKKWLPSKNKLTPNDETNKSSFKRITNRASGQFGRTGSSLVQTKGK